MKLDWLPSVLTCFPLEASVQGYGLFVYLRITCKTYEHFHFLQNVSDLLNSPFLRVLRDRFPLFRKKQYPESKKSNLQNCNSKVSTTWIHNISEPKTSLRITLLSHWGHRILDFQIFFFVKWPVHVCVCSVVSDSLWYHGQRNLVGYRPGHRVANSWTHKSNSAAHAPTQLH